MANLCPLFKVSTTNMIDTSCDNVGKQCSGLFADMGHFGKYHNTLCLSPQLLHKHCFQFLLGLTMATKTTLVQNLGGMGNKEYYGIFQNRSIILMTLIGKYCFSTIILVAVINHSNYIISYITVLYHILIYFYFYIVIGFEKPFFLENLIKYVCIKYVCM